MEGKSNLTALPASTIRLIGSTQVITSVYSVVKELIENSFDAEATVVDVKLDNYGLDKIEVKDNGLGINVHDVPFVGQRHYTSKITTHSDLQNLNTYGFRGEALASLCSVAEVTVTTKTKEDDISICYSLTNEGKVKNSKPSHLGQGTTIGVMNLFKNLPVRKQYHNTVKKKKTELKKIEDLLKAYSIIKPEIRITLRHNKEMIVQKTSLPDTKSAILNILGHSVSSLLDLKEESDSDTQVYIKLTSHEEPTSAGVCPGI
ncbi:PMS1 protein homolog 1 isoform X2 [Patella vulgata]|uniref:PMS1 protein homolog 1 isoform X2 n=1 Tax=Patella vulgata TaxID=6465 RepID=UPI0024A8183A|nr:PMS1 protein homolog 1 isoform X2 [Patella vulgata]